MGEYHIRGGRPLHGTISPGGAKNAVLPILAATVLNGGTSVIHNCPGISDTHLTVEILNTLGCRATFDGDTITVDSSGINNHAVPLELVKRMRSSIIFMGSMLGRFGEVTISSPGGCDFLLELRLVQITVCTCDRSRDKIDLLHRGGACMKRIKVCVVATTAELKPDIREIESFFRKMNDFYLDRELFFTLNTSVGRAADIAAFDLVFFLFEQNDSQASMDIVAAFDAALTEHKNNGKPNVSMYLKTDTDKTQTDKIEYLARLMELEHSNYVNTYGHIDTMLLGALMRIKLLVPDCVLPMLVDGKIVQGGAELLSLEHVEMFSGHEELRKLKTELAELDVGFTTAKSGFLLSPDDTAAYESFCALSKQRNEKTTEIRDIETRLYRIIENMHEQIVRGELSTRQEECYWLVEHGNYTKAKAVLDYDIIIRDIVQNECLADKTDKQAQIYINELLQLKDMNMTLADWPGVDACYREAVRLEERHNLSRKATAAYAGFLQVQNRHSESVNLAEGLRYHYQNPTITVLDAAKGRLFKLLGRIYCDTQRMDEAEESLNAALTAFSIQSGQDAFEILPDWAECYNLLGGLLSETRRFKEAETMYRSALDILKKLSSYNPDVYEPLLSVSYNDLGEVYRKTQRMAEAEEAHKTALDIVKKLAAKDSDIHLFSLAKTYNKLGVLYDETERFAEAETMFKTALEIQIKLAEQNPDAYDFHLSDIYNNLGLMYYFTKRPVESEKTHRRAIEIRKRLARRDPEAFERRLSNSYNSLGTALYMQERFLECEEANKAALEIRQRLAAKNPDAYDELVSDSCTNLGNIYEKLQRYDESEAMHKKALEITQKLAARDPDASEMDLADIYLNLGYLYRTTKRTAEAEDAFRSSLRLYSKYKEANPYCAKQSNETMEALESLYNIVPAGEKGTAGLAVMMSAFTPEEREIALLLTDGETQRDIARKLSLTAAEVSQRVTSIRDKVIGASDPDPVMAAIIYKFKLSRREANILRCLKQDMVNADIAAELFIAEETVRVHIHKLLKKLPVSNRQAVASWVKSFNDSDQN